jgi:hypothetical protein
MGREDFFENCEGRQKICGNYGLIVIIVVIVVVAHITPHHMTLQTITKCHLIVAIEAIF